MKRTKQELRPLVQRKVNPAHELIELLLERHFILGEKKAVFESSFRLARIYTPSTGQSTLD